MKRERIKVIWPSLPLTILSRAKIVKGSLRSVNCGLIEGGELL